MTGLFLFALKSLLIPGAALALTRIRGLTAAARHLILFLAILSLPVMAMLGQTSPDVLSIPAPSLALDWELQISIPRLEPGASQRPDAVHTRSLTLTRIVITTYWLGCATLLLYCLFKIGRTLIWVRRTRRLPVGDVPLNHPSTSRVTLRQSDRIHSPLTWGAIRADVVVPEDWTRWSDEKRHTVLLHEIAHVQRFDTFSSILSALVCCCFWINPLVWIAHRRLLTEAERACDDAVINHGVSPTSYADQLLEIARTRRLGFGPAMAATPTLPVRIRALVDPETRRSVMNLKQSSLILAMSAAIIVPLGSIGAEGEAGAEVSAQAAQSAQEETIKGGFASDGDIMAIAKVAPIYPRKARDDGVEGYVVVEFTVSATGRVINPVVVDATPPDVFDSAALDAVSRYKYKPRVVDGEAVDTTGIRNRITFELASNSKSTTAGAGTDGNPPPALSQENYDVLTTAQDLIDVKDFPGAISVLDSLLENTDELNNHEIAQVQNMRGFVYFSEENYHQAIAAYEQVVAREKEIPRGLHTTTLYTLAQLHFMEERFEESLGYMSDWQALAENPGPVPHIFTAQVQYRMNDYPAAIESLETGIQIARDREVTVKENWWALLNYLYFEQENWAKVVEILEILQKEYPSESYEERLRAVQKSIAGSAKS